MQCPIQASEKGLYYKSDNYPLPVVMLYTTDNTDSRLFVLASVISDLQKYAQGLKDSIRDSCEQTVRKMKGYNPPGFDGIASGVTQEQFDSILEMVACKIQQVSIYNAEM